MKSLSDDADSNDESKQQQQQHQQQHRPTGPSSSSASAAPGGILRLTAGEAELEAFSDTVRHLWCPQQQQQQQQPRGATRRTASDGNDDDDAGSSSQSSRNGIPILPEPPTALRFSRDFVGPNRPCIIRNAILVKPLKNRDGGDGGDSHDDGPGRVRQRADGGGDNNNAGFGEEGDHCVVPLHLDLDQICNLLPVHETMLTVDVTPDGHGDCVRTGVAVATSASASASVPHQASSSSSSVPCQVFARPKESRMSLFEFRRRLRKQDGTQDQQHQHQQRREENPLRSDAGDVAKSLPADVDVNQRPFVHILVDSDFGELWREQHQELQEQGLPDDSVVYYSRQNDCLRDGQEGISALRALLPANFPWAQEAFFFGDTSHKNNNCQGNDNNSAGGGGGNTTTDNNGDNIDAVNLWVGNSRAVSSMHKDHYENLMYVASGEKIFTLCPPADVVFLYEHLQYEQGIFEVLASGNGDSASPSWVVQRDSSADRQDEQEKAGGSGGSSSKVRWIAPDVSILLHGTARQRLELLHAYPLLRYAHPVEVRVRAGELLFLPKLWYHRVTQSCETVAINYWYEMAFDCSPLWCYYEFLQQLRHGEDDGDDVVAELASDIPAIP